MIRDGSHRRTLFQKNTLGKRLLGYIRLGISHLKSRTTGINEAQVSRIKSGDQVWIGSDNLVRLSNGLFPAQSEAAAKCHARLLYARLQDKYSGISAKFISIKLEADLAFPAATNYPKPMLPPKIQQHLYVIGNHIIEYRHVRDMAEILANFCQCKVVDGA